MQDLLIVRVELAAYRKGCLTVQLNFQEAIMSWEESRQWCNNFVRSLSDEQVRETMDILAKSGLLTVMPPAISPVMPPAARTAGQGSSLFILLTYADRQIELAEADVPPDAWASLRSQIEKLSRVPFQL